MTRYRTHDHSFLASFAAALILALLLAGLVPAQGLHIGPGTPDPVTDPVPTQPTQPQPGRPIHPLGLVRITSLAVKTQIVDGIASTELQQVFHNDGRRIAEGIWVLPLPEGATADHFTMTMGGKQVPGEVLDANSARRTYEQIVRRQRDPGLLEYMGKGCLRARIFPIPPQGEITVVVRYRQVLPQTAGLHAWSFPLRAAKVGGRPAERISMDVQIKSQKAVKNVYSPSSGVDILRKGDHDARVSLELIGSQMPATDLEVFYGLSDQEFGLNLLTYRKAEADGYFLMMLSPKRSWEEQSKVAKVIQFVLDTSGSMQGKKIEQARAALRFFLGSLKDKDYFNVIPFSTEARPFFAGPVEAGKGNIDKALGMVGEVEARGGTNISDALTVAMQAKMPQVEDRQYVPITVFLTDGLPTVGTTDIGQLLAAVKKENSLSSRIFVFGVGSDVNTQLLDKIAEQSRGERDYVREQESIEVKTGALFTKLSHPVMTDVRLDCEGIHGFDIYPKRTPDLFKGSRLLVMGRYKGKGHYAVRLSGTVNGVAKEYVYDASFPENATANDFIPTLWAQRKVAVLLDAIRLNGAKPELVSEVQRLGREFGIVTPYTSHLILEEGMQVAGARLPGFRPEDGFRRFGQGGEGRGRVLEELKRQGALTAEATEEEVEDLEEKSKKEADKARGKLADMPKAAVGENAVADSMELKALRKAGRALGGGGGAVGLSSRRIKDRSFHLIEGVWVDSRFKAEMREKIHKVKAYSDEYFALLRQQPELAPFLAFSSSIVLVLKDQVIEIVDSSKGE